MKTLLTILTIASLSVGSQAATIDWSISGRATNPLYEYDGTTVAASTTLYLILADSTSLATITDVQGKDKFEDALEAITVDTTAAGSDGKKPAVTVINSESALLTAGTSYKFGMLYLSTDAAGTCYYKIATADGTAYDASIQGQSGTAATSFSTMASASWTKGYTPVPEPSTAALALAGLALLLKRRKA